MGLESLSLRRQGAVDQRSTFKECVEVLYERTLVVVPPEAKLLVVLHGSGFLVSAQMKK